MTLPASFFPFASTHSPQQPDWRHAQWGVWLVFFNLGLGYASWLALIPVFRNQLALGHDELGTALLAAGVKIYQFEGGLLHTKSVLVDGELSLVGTVNLDMRSLWLNFEITLVIDDAGFGGDLAAVQDDYISRSRLLDARLWVKRPLWQRIAERLFYFFSPLL